jgi:hypothetical protein
MEQNNTPIFPDWWESFLETIFTTNYPNPESAPSAITFDKDLPRSKTEVIFRPYSGTTNFHEYTSTLDIWETGGTISNTIRTRIREWLCERYQLSRVLDGVLALITEKLPTVNPYSFCDTLDNDTGVILGITSDQHKLYSTTNSKYRRIRLEIVSVRDIQNNEPYLEPYLLDGDRLKLGIRLNCASETSIQKAIACGVRHFQEALLIERVLISLIEAVSILDRNGNKSWIDPNSINITARFPWTIWYYASRKPVELTILHDPSIKSSRLSAITQRPVPGNNRSRYIPNHMSQTLTIGNGSLNSVKLAARLSTTIIQAPEFILPSSAPTAPVRRRHGTGCNSRLLGLPSLDEPYKEN